MRRPSSAHCATIHPAHFFYLCRLTAFIFLAITMLTALIQIFPLYFASFSSSIQPCSPIRLCHRSSHRNSGMRIRLQILVSFLKLSICYWDPKESVGLQRCSLICAIYIDICAFCSSGRVMPSQDDSLRWL